MLHPRRAVHQSRHRRPRVRRLRSDPPPRRERRRGAGRRAGRALFLHALHLRRLLEPPGQDARRRSAATSCTVGDMALRDARRLHPPDRPQEEHDHLRRREHLSRPRSRRCSAPARRSRTSRSSACPTRSGASGSHARRRAARRRHGDEAEMIDCCRDADRAATSARARSPSCAEHDMPRTATGKVLHRVLRDRIVPARDDATDPAPRSGDRGEAPWRDRANDSNSDEQACAAWVARVSPGARRRPRLRPAGRPHPADLGPRRPARHPHHRRPRRGRGGAHGACPCGADRPARRRHGRPPGRASPTRVTAIANASLARAPVLLIGGCTSRPQANMGPLQDIPHVDILRPVSRSRPHRARAPSR